MTSSIKEAIREHNRFARMRMGQDTAEIVSIPSMPEIRVAQVPLTERESQAGIIRASLLEVQDNAAGLQARNRAAIESDVWNSLREPANPQTKVFDSIEDMTDQVQASDIDHLADNLMLLMSYASPAIDGLTDKELEELKKAFGETDWSALTGKRWAAVKLCVSTLFPELLQVRSLGSSLTESSTTTNENGEST